MRWMSHHTVPGKHWRCLPSSLWPPSPPLVKRCYCCLRIIVPHELSNVSFQKIEEELLARQTKVMEQLKNTSVKEWEETPTKPLAVKEETVAIMVEEGILVTEEKAEMKGEFGLCDLFVKEELIIEDTLAENVTEETWEKDDGNLNSKEKPYHCKVLGCEKKFGNKGTLKAHIRKLHFKKYESNVDLERQIRGIDSQEKPYPCKEPGCVQRFGGRGNLKSHISIVHLKETPYQCEESDCDKKFSMKSGLNVHIRTVHQKEKPYPCKESSCDKKFGLKATLRVHIRNVHIKSEPHICEEDGCGRVFGQKGNLDTHIKIKHLKKKQYACTESNCDKKFGRKDNLNTHTRTVHYKEKRYTCKEPDCDKAFGQMSGLQKHICANQKIEDKCVEIKKE